MNFDVTDFEPMRPFRDDEIPAVMRRICNDVHFPLIAKWVYPEKNAEEVKDILYEFTDIRDFQVETMRRVNERILNTTTDGLTCDGFDNLDKDKRYLFISNHRDIMLDACFLQYLLWQNGHETSEITFGSNLMGLQIVDDIGRANKMFKVERAGSMREFYKSSLLLSKYIRHTICEKKQSIWIAQRNGRTKDGIDRTEPGLIKMLMLSGEKGKFKQSLLDLDIVPMSVSYEWEPCDFLKAKELYESKDKRYIKKPGEDLNSILTGILQPKGRVHIHLGKPIGIEDLASIKDDDQPALMQTTSRILDERIRRGYKLWPNNHAAYDILHEKTGMSAHYTMEEMSKLSAHIADTTSQIPDPARQEIRNIMLRIYAGPLN